MQIGFKTGPKNWAEGQTIVREHGAKLCEIWFRIDKADDYASMLHWLKTQHVKAGLHHWGLIEGTYKPNISSQNSNIRQATLQQIKDTIDIGANIDCAYVNAHCGAQGVETISFEGGGKQALIEFDPTKQSEAEAIFRDSAQVLHEYAQKRGVTLTIETLVGLEPTGLGRSDLYDAGNIHYEHVYAFGKNGGYIANDITHTASQICLQDQNMDSVWQKLLEFTKRAAPFTKLLHLNTMTPPFNGVDTHNGVLVEDFAAGAFPSEAQLNEWFKIFAGRDDLFVVPEPRNKMLENYLALQKLVESIQ